MFQKFAAIVALGIFAFSFLVSALGHEAVCDHHVDAEPECVLAESMAQQSQGVEHSDTHCPMKCLCRKNDLRSLLALSAAPWSDALWAVPSSIWGGDTLYPKEYVSPLLKVPIS